MVRQRQRERAEKKKHKFVIVFKRKQPDAFLSVDERRAFRIKGDNSENSKHPFGPLLMIIVSRVLVIERKDNKMFFSELISIIEFQMTTEESQILTADSKNSTN